MHLGNSVDAAVCLPLPRHAALRLPRAWPNTPQHRPSLLPHFSCTPRFSTQYHRSTTTMVRKDNSKGIEAVGSKSLVKKRAADNGEVKSPRKRQKKFSFLDIGEEVGTLIKQEEIVKEATEETAQETVEAVVKETYGEYQERIKDQVFRFMDLPGELRNRIYEYATEYAHRCFPPIFPKQKKKRRVTPYVRMAVLSSMIMDDFRPIPHLGLTQACALIRTEFRPMWLSVNRIPLCALTGYLKTFYPPTPTNPSARKRFESFQDQLGGHLSISLRRAEMEGTDMIKLLKHRLRFPGLKIRFDSQRLSYDNDLSIPLGLLVDNDNPKWEKWIKSNVITQVRFKKPSAVRIVVKERYAPDWMKATLHADRNVDPKFVESLGLTELAKLLTISFGVDY